MSVVKNEMKSSASVSVGIEQFINNWNGEFPEFTLTSEDLKKPHSVMGALFQIFDRLGIDKETVLMPPTEINLNEHVKYYWDLLPVINMTRVINHLVSVMPRFATISINHFLQPSVHTSHSILLLLFNLMIFNEHRLQSIIPYEEEVFKFNDMIKTLEERKVELLGQLNKQAEEKGLRAGKMEQMQKEIELLEEEIRREEQIKEQEQHDLEAFIKDNNTKSIMVDQKKATKEGLLAERERKIAQRVYDADDIRAQVALATQNVKEAEEKMNSVKAIITQKENSLQILQTIEPNLDTAINLLDEITKLKDSEMCDLDEESKDGELGLLNTDLMELQAQESELATRREEDNRKYLEEETQRKQEKIFNENALREAEEKDKKRREFTAKATQRTEEIKKQTLLYQNEKVEGIETIVKMKQEYNTNIKQWEEALMKLVMDVKMDLANMKPFQLDS